MAGPQPKYTFYISLALVTVAGLLLLFTSHWVSVRFFIDLGWQVTAERVLNGIGEAVLIAAILAITVDRFIKERLVREMSSDTAKYLIGFQLPNEIQDSIRDLMRSDLIQRNVNIHYDLLKSESDPNHLLLHQTISYELTNMYHSRKMFHPGLKFEESDHATVLEMKGSSISDDGAEKVLFSLKGTEVQSKVDPNTKMVEWRGVRHKIRPYKDGGRYLYAHTVQKEVRLEDNEVFAFDLAAIGITITARVPIGLRFASNEATLHVGTRWEYHRVFLPGQHITVRWFQEKPTPPTDPADSKPVE